MTLANTAPSPMNPSASTAPELNASNTTATVSRPGRTTRARRSTIAAPPDTGDAYAPARVIPVPSPHDTRPHVRQRGRQARFHR
jgi:hypothetical protein